MNASRKHILVLDGKGAAETIAALALRKQHADDREANPHADSCEPSRRVHDPKKQFKPLDHAGHKDWDGIDPVYDEDMRQYDEEEEHIGPEELARRAIIQHPALATIDGMQAYRFHGRYPYAPGKEAADPHAQDPNHLEYWLRRIQEELGAGEKLDAIVIPSRVGPLDPTLLQPLLTRAKAANPELKVILVQERASPDGANPPLVDAVISRARLRDLGGIVREQIGMPQLPPPDPDLMRNLNLEANRERALAMRRYTVDTLPPWLSRKGDPNYQPPASEKDPKDSPNKGGRGRG